MRDYRKIKVWQLGDDLTVEVYRVSADFPREETYGLTSQLRRAAYSVPANICEGASRSGSKEFLQFLYIARGSSNETQYFIHLAHRLGYLHDDQFGKIEQQAQEVGKTLTGLIKAVEREAGPLKRTAARIVAWFTLLAATMATKSSISV